ncbi:flagellar filament capping protein FliD [Butyrivibrio sp. AE2032]|uniref:flagellar filament capping protein FliD n=1 Tax=Butyrivibrio sp. AE2032 TaxID=1458463 RepID=UPI000550F07A|nr:flagellar filament capping protein FliD [Butyrivibrio sp. AE2032]
MPIRITGMNSGLDTESIITALTSTKQTKLDNFKGDQKKLTWKQEKWKELNKKVTSFYNGALSNLRFSTAYTKKVTTASHENAVSIVTGNGAMDTTQTLDINDLATSSYLTGKKLSTASGDAKTSTKMKDLGLSDGGELKFKIGDSDTDVISVKVNANESISDVLTKLRNASSSETKTKLNFNFDENNSRFYVSAKEAGKDASFHLESTDAMSALGFSFVDADGNDVANEADSVNYVAGSDARITLNGVEYTSKNNVFDINGLTITAKQKQTGIQLTTKQDTSGIYDNIKAMIKEYSELMKEFATLYNADKATKYKMLTDDEKEAMGENEVEEWENKIKEGLLSGDDTISSIRTALKSIVNSSFEVTLKDGTKANYSLASFGITTGDYFGTDENERDILHIDGDKDDSTTSGNTDLLSQAISSDPAMVQDFFIQLSRSMYSKIGDLMKGTEYSSSFTIYEDKLMASQYSAYTTKIDDAQKALEAAQDKLYSKFSKMETALSKVNNTSSTISSYFGMGTSSQ